MHTDFERTRQIFLEIVERPAAQWDTLLNEACATDAVLRQQVAVLLQAHARGDGILDRNHAGEAPTGVFESWSERPGTAIGPYKLLQQIGEGGMGVVWMAEQIQPLRRTVALKVIKPGMDSRQVVARFEAERQALAMMDHVNIARVFDGGATETGRPYFVMELVHGVPITKYCDDHQLTPRERLELFVPVCQAIQHAHQKGIIHRDVKPSNVMVTLYDGKPVPKVIDFGVAKATEQKLSERTLFTHYGTLVGTLEYMSPEQAEMSALGVDTRSDIYSLGVLLYELLTGSTPLSHKRVKETAHAEIVRIIKEEEPPRPSIRLSDSGDALASISAQRHTEPAKLAKLLRGELDWIVMRCLEKDRTRRYETASALARDVERHLHHEPVEAGSPSKGYRFKKFASKNRKLLGTAAAFVQLLVLSVLVSAWLALRATSERNEKQSALVQLEKEQKTTKAALADQTKARHQTREALNTMTDEVIEELFAKQPQLGEHEKAFLRKVLGFYQTFAADKGDTEEARSFAAHGQFSVARMRGYLGEMSEAAAGYREAIRLLEKLVADFPTVPTYRELLAGCHNNLGGLQVYVGQLPAAETAYRQALVIEEKLVAELPAEPRYRLILAGTLRNLGNLLSDQHKPAEAEPLLRRTLEIADRLATDFPTVPEYRQRRGLGHYSLGVLQRDRGQRPAAATAFRHALAIQEKLVADFPAAANYRSNLAHTVLDLGVVLRQLGKQPEAEATLRRALKMGERLAADFPSVPQYHSHVGATCCNFGLLLVDQARAQDALDWYARSIRLLEANLAQDAHRLKDRLLLYDAYSGRANTLTNLKRNAEAVKDRAQALAIREKLAADGFIDPEQRTELAGNCVNLGNQIAAQGQAQDALEWYAKAIRLLQTNLAQNASQVKDRLFLRNAHLNRAGALTNLKRRAEAVQDWDQALAIGEKLADEFPAEPEYREQLARGHTAKGVLLIELGKRSEAESAFRQALAIWKKLAADFATVPKYRQELAHSHSNLGFLLRELGRRPEAVTAFSHAQAIEEKLVVDFPTVSDYREELAACFGNLGRLLHEVGRRPGAETAYRRALAIEEKLVADFNTVPRYRKDLADYHHNLGSVLYELDRRPEAETAIRQALAIREKAVADFPTLPEYRQQLAQNYDGLGMLLRHLGKGSEAETAFRQALAIREKLVADFPNVPAYRTDLAAHPVPPKGQAMPPKGQTAPPKGARP
jgi:eukaryotic-like serine/threonine-protein kinase